MNPLVLSIFSLDCTNFSVDGTKRSAIKTLFGRDIDVEARTQVELSVGINGQVYTAESLKKFNMGQLKAFAKQFNIRRGI